VPATIQIPADASAMINANAVRVADALALNPDDRARVIEQVGQIMVVSHRFTPAGHTQTEAIGRFDGFEELIAGIDAIVDDRLITKARLMSNDAFLLFYLHVDKPRLNVLSLRASGLYGYQTSVSLDELSPRAVVRARLNLDDYTVARYPLAA
jgi:hypothetical protein